MRTARATETSRDRKALVADAGYPSLSLFSAFAGALSAVGALTVAAGVAAALARARGRDVELPPSWQVVDLYEAMVVVAGLLVAFLVGGYVAGRMARRSGVLHGLAVAVLGVAAGAGAYVAADITAPATAVVSALGAVAAGALIGAVSGERWHARLLARAMDPDIGAEARARKDAERRAADADRLREGSFRRVRLATRSRRVSVEGDAPRPVAVGDPAYAGDRFDTGGPVGTDGAGATDGADGTGGAGRIDPPDLTDRRAVPSGERTA